MSSVTLNNTSQSSLTAFSPSSPCSSACTTSLYSTDAIPTLIRFARGDEGAEGVVRRLLFTGEAEEEKAEEEIAGGADG